MAETPRARIWQVRASTTEDSRLREAMERLGLPSQGEAIRRAVQEWCDRVDPR